MCCSVHVLRCPLGGNEIIQNESNFLVFDPNLLGCLFVFLDQDARRGVPLGPRFAILIPQKAP
jgi:hypothetical protein